LLIRFFGNDRRQSEITGNSIMISANADLTPKWKAFQLDDFCFQNGVTFTQLRFERDLWRMDFNGLLLEPIANWVFLSESNLVS
jgi:hypothetical protein